MDLISIKPVHEVPQSRILRRCSRGVELHPCRADRLHVSQPPFSKQIHDLEGELGIEFFERQRKGVALTPADKSTEGPIGERPWHPSLFITRCGADVVRFSGRSVVRQITRSNPAHSVRGPKYVVKKGKTPVWSREDAKTLLNSIPKDSVSGLRDLTLIAAMFYSFARVSAGCLCDPVQSAAA
jgi:hypothetical protein